MKIRIKGNTLRLRLSKSALSKLEQSGIVSEQIDFRNSKLTYQLQRNVAIDDIQIDFTDNIISVNVPSVLLDKWIATEQVGFNAKVKYSNGQGISLLVEKDFQCLKVREGEDESDLFTNPQMTE